MLTRGGRRADDAGRARVRRGRVAGAQREARSPPLPPPFSAWAFARARRPCTRWGSAGPAPPAGPALDGEPGRRGSPPGIRWPGRRPGDRQCPGHCPRADRGRTKPPEGRQREGRLGGSVGQCHYGADSESLPPSRRYRAWLPRLVLIFPSNSLTPTTQARPPHSQARAWTGERQGPSCDF